jgi:phosphoglycolate phosphatase/putative hydrolase of the HAD superfamily
VTDNRFSADRLRVVVFDVDGTLYRQRPLRRAMASRLVRSHVLRPVEGWRTFRALSAYRRAQESLRAGGSGDAADRQIALACEQAGLDREAVVRVVERWMEREPLTILRRCIQPGLVSFLQTCRMRGLRLAALSDYPATDKLAALGIAEWFDLVLCAQAAEIGVFKPNPRGLLVALQKFGVNNEESLYVGDRADVDAAAAAAARMPCVILSGNAPGDTDTHHTVAGYTQLQDLLFPSVGATAPGGVPQ